jgi:hypothetical protein
MIALGSLEQLRRQSLDELGHMQLERAEWSVRQAGRLAQLAGDARPWQSDAVTVVSDRLVFRPRLIPVA